jgi:hypothetical protein
LHHTISLARGVKRKTQTGIFPVWVTMGDKTFSSKKDPMTKGKPAKQFSFRLPENLVSRVEQCMETLRDAGLDLNRADMVRLLIKHALDATQCEIGLLLASKEAKQDAAVQAQET